MQNENELAGTNGQAEIIAAGPDSRVFLSTKDAIEKYDLSNSVLYSWREKKGLTYDKAAGGWLDSDLARLANDPGYRRRSKINSAAALKAHGSKKTKRGKYKKPRGLVAAPAPAAHEPNLTNQVAYHVAYLAGRTDEFINNYARAHRVDEHELAQNLGRLLDRR